VSPRPARRPIVPDLLAPGLRLVFCGTAPSTASAAARAYYAKPGNRFWKTLHEVGLTPRRFAPAEYPALLALGIGLTDLNKVQSGNDDELDPRAFDCAGFAAKMQRAGPALIAFTSKTAGARYLGHAVAYGEQPERLGGARLFVLPSTSGQAVRYFDLGPWRALAQAAGSARR